MSKVTRFLKGRVFDPAPLIGTICAIAFVALAISVVGGLFWFCSNYPEAVAAILVGGIILGAIGCLIYSSFPKKEAYEKSIDETLEWMRGVGGLKDEAELAERQVEQMKEILHRVHSLAKGILEGNSSCSDPLKEELTKIMDMTEEF